jgi:uroporphyrinogen decarboxylase
MTHRDRILAVVRHQVPDRVALDLGSTIATTMTAQAHARLVAHLGLPAEPPPIAVARRSSTVIPHEAILRRFDVDARPLLLGSPDACPDRDISEDAFRDEWNVTWTRAKGGHFINTDGPFYRLDEPSLQDLEKFPWPDPQNAGRYRGLRERARTLNEETDYAVILSLPVGPVHQCQFVRGYGAWLEDLLVHPVFAEGLLARITQIWVEIAHRALEEAGDFVDVVMYGDDIAIQRSTLFRPDLYRRLIKPQHRKMAEAVRQHGKLILYHSCGAVYTFVPDLIELGITALNPVQVSAADMDTRRLKREFGRDLTFWGAIDTHRVLPTGTPEEVRQEVRRRIDELGAGGGYVLCAVHNIQPEVPPENVVAMYEAAREYGG